MRYCWERLYHKCQWDLGWGFLPSATEPGGSGFTSALLKSCFQYKISLSIFKKKTMSQNTPLLFDLIWSDINIGKDIFWTCVFLYLVVFVQASVPLSEIFSPGRTRHSWFSAAPVLQVLLMFSLAQSWDELSSSFGVPLWSWHFWYCWFPNSLSMTASGLWVLLLVSFELSFSFVFILVLLGLSSPGFL